VPQTNPTTTTTQPTPLHSNPRRVMVPLRYRDALAPAGPSLPAGAFRFAGRIKKRIGAHKLLADVRRNRYIRSHKVGEGAD
jgi:hypothetical protein